MLKEKKRKKNRIETIDTNEHNGRIVRSRKR